MRIGQLLVDDDLRRLPTLRPFRGLPVAALLGAPPLADQADAAGFFRRECRESGPRWAPLLRLGPVPAARQRDGHLATDAGEVDVRDAVALGDVAHRLLPDLLVKLLSLVDHRFIAHEGSIRRPLSVAPSVLALPSRASTGFITFAEGFPDPSLEGSLAL
jgi:hypothetical protein